MFRFACFGLGASVGFQLAAGFTTVVRKVSTYDGDASQSAYEDQAERGGHCVVWGDFSFEGKNFRSKEQADTYFNQIQSTELAAAQYHGLREVHRFKSRRLTHVDWVKMKNWCQENRNASPERAEAPPSWEGAQDRGSSLFEAASAVPRMSRRSGYNPVVASLAGGGAGTTLSGRVDLLEGEVNSLASKASALLKSIGVDSTSSNGASMLQLGPKSHGQGKLKSRVAALKEYTAGVHQKTNLLEVELFGASTAEKSTPLQEASKAAISFRLQIETVGTQVDELKSRLSALESTPLFDDVAKLEDKTGLLGAEAAKIFTSIGVENVKAPTKPTVAQALKARLGSLEEYTEDLQRNAGSLEYEILGNSWSRPSTSVSTRSAGTSIKDHAASLGEHLQDLKNRLSALANSPIVADVGNMEQMVTSLSSRAASLSENAGISSSKSSQQDLSLAPQGAPIKSRIVSLEGYVGAMQSTTAALEQELSGNVGTAPAQSQKDTLKSKARFLELQIENLNSRMSSLEQQI